MSDAPGGEAGSAGPAGGSGGGSALQNLAKIASRYQGTGDAHPTQHSPQKKQRVTPAVSDLSSQKSASTNLTATQLAGTLHGFA